MGRPKGGHKPRYDYEQCYWCGRYAKLHCHHVFEGSTRQASDKYGLTVNLCPQCHSAVHSGKGLEMRNTLHQEFQKVFELDHTREEFIKEFIKSYL